VPHGTPSVKEVLVARRNGERRDDHNAHNHQHEQQPGQGVSCPFLNRTPTPPPFSGMNSTPAASRAERMAAAKLFG
jgi:hypothetical protein